MQNSAQLTTSTTPPLLASKAITRKETDAMLPGRYCEERDMWVVKIKNGEEPIIEAAQRLAELTTKSKVTNESDDDDALLRARTVELLTKTAAQTEADDNDDGEESVPPAKILAATLNLSTKTDAKQESDD